MGAMVLHVVHRFKHAIFAFRALLFHCSNFKDFYREQIRTVTFPLPQGYATTLHHAAIFPAIFQFAICANRRTGSRYGLEQWLYSHHSTYLLYHKF